MDYLTVPLLLLANEISHLLLDLLSTVLGDPDQGLLTPSVSFLTPFLCDNVCLNRRKVAFNHSFTWRWT